MSCPIKTDKRQTSQEAFADAANTGCIAITKETATILQHMAQLNDLMATLVDDFTAPYEHSPKQADEISGRLYDAYADVQAAVRQAFSEHLADNVLSNLYFEGI